MANRTDNGTVTKQARDEHGMADHHGAFPVFDQHSALSAVKLRHNGKGISAASVLAKVEAWAKSNNNKTVLAVVEAARVKDKQRQN